MSKVWEETWYTRHNSACRWEVCRKVDEPDAYGRLVATVDDDEDDIPAQGARARVAAAAPDLVRALLAVEREWIAEGCACIVCGGHFESTLYRDHDWGGREVSRQARIDHAADCPLDAALRKAGVCEPQNG